MYSIPVPSYRCVVRTKDYISVFNSVDGRNLSSRRAMLNELWRIHTKQCNTAIKKDEVIHMLTWNYLQNI